MRDGATKSDAQTESGASSAPAAHHAAIEPSAETSSRQPTETHALVGTWDVETRQFRVFSLDKFGKLVESTIHIDENSSLNLIPGDYNGDGQLDLAAYNHSERLLDAWTLVGRPIYRALKIPKPGKSTDAVILIAGDYDGDGYSDLALSSTTEWYVYSLAKRRKIRSVRDIRSPSERDVLLPTDYDGDGRTDLGLWRPSTRSWYAWTIEGKLIFDAVRWGESSDTFVPGDYDGDGKAELAVYRLADSTWHILNRVTQETSIIQLGATGDVPVPADYDGDKRTDPAVWRPGNGTFYASTLLDPFDPKTVGVKLTKSTYLLPGPKNVCMSSDQGRLWFQCARSPQIYR